MSETLGDISVPLQLRTEGSGSGNLANCQDYVDQKQTEMLKELPSSLIKCPTNGDGQAHPVVEAGISEVEYVESENLKDVDDVDLTLEEMDDSAEAGVYTLTHPTGGEFKLETRVYERLLQHQRSGLDWLWYIHCHLSGGILCDDRGTGKTLQICSFLAGLFGSKLIKNALIVAPAKVISHWREELHLAGLDDKFKGIVLTTYDCVRAKTITPAVSEVNWKWDYIILDEGQHIKNPKTKTAQNLLDIPCICRIIIIASPVQNNLKELKSLLGFCSRQLFGFQRFEDDFEKPIMRGMYKNASEETKMASVDALKKLREISKPYLLRRKHNEIDMSGENKLPVKDEFIVWLKLTPCQQSIYKKILEIDKLEDNSEFFQFARLAILKKVCNHPRLLMEADGGSNAIEQAKNVASAVKESHKNERFDVGCKITFILSLLKDELVQMGHKVLVFTQTHKMSGIIEEAFKSNKLEYMKIDRKTKDRQFKVNSFQKGHSSILLLTTGASVGLALTVADRVIIVDPDWNPSIEHQCSSCTYRIGQKKDVIVYRLITSGTIEEKIYRKQVLKEGVRRVAIDGKDHIQNFSEVELGGIFKSTDEGFSECETQKKLQEDHGVPDNEITEYLNSHMTRLQSMDIAGLTYHNLVFSKNMDECTQTGEETPPYIQDHRAIYPPCNNEECGIIAKIKSLESLLSGKWSRPQRGSQVAQVQHDVKLLKAELLRLREQSRIRLARIRRYG